MKRLLTLLLLTTLLFTSCELIQDKPPQPKVWGVFIGLDYENTSLDTLAGTLNDAFELEEAFEHVSNKATLEYESFLMYQRGSGFGPNAEEYEVNGEDINSYASIENLQKLFEALKSVVKEEDLLIVTYHGHSDENILALAPRNQSDTGKIKTDEEFLMSLEPIKGRTLVILDSCYSGMSVPPSQVSVSLVYEPPLKEWFETYYSKSKYSIPPITLFTAAADTESWELPSGEHGHGIFTSALLKALGGYHDAEKVIHFSDVIPALKNGVISVDTLYQYVKTHQEFPLKTTLYSHEHYYQHPMTNGGPIDLVLFHL